MTYNKADTLFHRVAKRIESNAKPLLDELDIISQEKGLELPGLEGRQGAEDFGDLEPSKLLLQVLTSAVEPAASDEATQDWLGSLFAYELAKPKEPTPPPPPKSRRHTEPFHSRWAAREAAAKERAASGTAGRRTRASGVGVTPDDIPDAAPKVEPKESTRARDRTQAEGSTRAKGSTEAEESTEAIEELEQTRESGANEEEDEEEQEDVLRALSKPQRGVIGVQAISVLTDKERRERERALDPHLAVVDKEEEFRRFNVGWVLPEGSKRSRVVRVPPPPPRPPGKSPISEFRRTALC